jgi:hypothetical protein
MALLPIPPIHPLDGDDPSSVFNSGTELALGIDYMQTSLEHLLFLVAGVRVVKGLEPWDRWGRAERRFLNLNIREEREEVEI